MVSKLCAKLSRREFINKSLSYYSTLVLSPLLSSCNSDSSQKPEAHWVSNLTNLGPLNNADENGCRLPDGFSCRVIARTSLPVIPSKDFKWHYAPDGGACFLNGDGWIYVSNSEKTAGNGGASAIKFDASGSIVDSYSILTGTTRNCAGGATPYGTWLSCEENKDIGRVFECDPKGNSQAVERPALGYFNHEAIAYDTDQHILYLTEDRRDGKFYRFIPDKLTSAGFANLSSGRLEVAQVTSDNISNSVDWIVISDPLASILPTRYQDSLSTPFNGGEGIAYFNGLISFTTKGDNKVWVYSPLEKSIKVIYDQNISDPPILSGVDNITVNFAGEYLVAEDGGDMQLIVLTKEGGIMPLLSLEGQSLSEITGPAFSPDGSRLYFSSQRGITGYGEDGITYEVTGPFFSIL